MIEYKAKNKQKRHLFGVCRIQLLYEEICLGRHSLHSAFSPRCTANADAAQIAGITAPESISGAQLTQLHGCLMITSRSVSGSVKLLLPSDHLHSYNQVLDD